MHRIFDRRTRRFEIKIPLRIRAFDSGAATLAAESVNVSATGLYFRTNLQLKIGAPVEILLKMPEEIVGRPSKEWRCNGQIVRVDGGNSLRKKFGVAVKSHYYEVSSGHFQPPEANVPCMLK